MTGVRTRRLGALALLAWAWLTLFAVPASAHASLSSTAPADGAQLDAAPSEVVLTFTEPVEVPPAGVRVFDASGARVDTGAVRHLDPSTVSAGLEAGLGDGSYIVTWRAVSEDGHPIRGALVYGVGDADAVDEALLSRLFAGDGEAVVETLAALVRALAYAGALLAGGALLFRVHAAADQPREGARAEAWARRGAWIGLAATLCGIPLQAMVTTGFGPLEALAPDVLGTAVASSVGVGALLRGAALVVVLVTLARRSVWPALAAAATATLSFAVDGHTRTVEPAWVLVTGDLVHLAAAAAWLGGIVVLAATVRSRRAEDDPVGAARLVARFSTVATISVLGLVVAGGALSWALVRQPRALTSTGYGWTLLAKVALALVVIGVGAYNNRQLVPRATQPAAWARLGATLRFEAVVLALVLAVTGLLVNQRPAAESAGITGAYEVYVDVTADLELNLVVDPNRAGANEIHLYLLDRTGRPADDVEDVRLRLTKPADDIGPIERVPFEAGPGHWVLAGRELSLPGEWLVEAVIGIDRFTEETVEIPVAVNP